MESYIFILGRNPELSRHELFSYLDSRKISNKVLDTSDIAVVLQINNFNAEKAMKILGGTQKIAKVISSLDNLYFGTKNKVRYAISTYTNEKESIINELKEYFKKEGLKATIKKSHFKQSFLTPSEAKNVIEIIQYKHFMGIVTALFNPKEYKFRDSQRPVQRPLHTISIRLAKILINLSGARAGQTILDPFCGIGTILQESLLMNINTVGIDKDKSCIESSNKNLLWLKNNYKITSKFRLYNIDSRQLSKNISQVDCVATEPYMGPFMKSFPTEREANKILQELTSLYSDLFRELYKITKHTIVIVTPIFPTKSKKLFQLNFEQILKNYKLKYNKPILYKSPTSKILREIWVIKKI